MTVHIVNDGPVTFILDSKTAPDGEARRAAAARPPSTGGDAGG
jgi:hypothetical protein